jgi:hypothetical protein
VREKFATADPYVPANNRGVISALTNKAVRFSLSGLIIIIILAIGVLSWYNNVYANTERVFWDMVENNLATNSITKEINQGSGNSSADEFSQLSFTPNPLVRDVKKVTGNSGQSTVHITVESIGTPKDTYQHYLLIQQPGKSQEKFRSVYPLWLRNGGNAQSDTTLFNQKLLDSGILFGSLPLKQRSQTIDYLRSAYSVNFDSAKKEKINGRRVFTYSAKLKLRNYFTAVHYYAKSMNLPTADQIKPENYKASDQFSLTISVDVLSRQINNIIYPSTGTTEQYSGYGIMANFSPPKSTASYQKLQDTIQSASQ